ncbi:MAG: hypothetical protein M3Q70_02275 [bacterium]|nr:hypothetical protein [bacterium]
MESSTPIRIQTVVDASLGDYAWRVGARSRQEVQRSLQTEIDAMHERFGTKPLSAASSLVASESVSLRYV